MTTINRYGRPSKLRLRENFNGSDGTGSDGGANRVFTLATSYTIEIAEVFLDGVLLVENTDYTKTNSTKQVTILSNVFDTQIISIIYNA